MLRQGDDPHFKFLGTEEGVCQVLSLLLSLGQQANAKLSSTVCFNWSDQRLESVQVGESGSQGLGIGSLREGSDLDGEVGSRCNNLHGRVRFNVGLRRRRLFERFFLSCRPRSSWRRRFATRHGEEQEDGCCAQAQGKRDPRKSIRTPL